MDDLVKRMRSKLVKVQGSTATTQNEWSSYVIDPVCAAAADRIETLEAALRDAYRDCLSAVEKVKSDPFTELGKHHKGRWGDTTARDWMVAFAEDVEREIKARAALAGEKKDD